MKAPHKDAALYELVAPEHWPTGLRWTRHSTSSVEYSFGKLYKRVTSSETGEQTYYKLIATDAPLDKTRIDAEPEKPKQVRYHVGKSCWYVHTDARWFLCVVVARRPEPEMTITIRPVTGKDATREMDWPFGGGLGGGLADELEISSRQSSQLFKRLRPLRARTP